MKQRRTDMLCAGLVALCAIGCSSDPGDRISVGKEPKGGNTGSLTGSGGASDSAAGKGGHSAVGDGDAGLTVHVEDIQKINVEVVTLACAGDCADIEAVALGGNPPYAFEWEDGGKDPKRHVCLDADQQLRVSTTDTAIDDDEFSYDAQTVSTEVSAQVLACSDGGVCAAGAGPVTPQSGHYEGSGTYVCDNDMDPATAMAINYGELALDLAIDPDREQQTGHLFFQWGLVVIVAEANLDGTLACGSGEFVATIEDGAWGLPGDGQMLGIVTGAIEGDVTAKKAGSDGSIAGTFHWISSVPDGSISNECHVTYQAQLQP